MKKILLFVVIFGIAYVLLTVYAPLEQQPRIDSRGFSVAHPTVITFTAHLNAFVVTRPPSLAPTFINRVLTAAHSPAAGTGQTLYDLARQYNIDDAFALAIFKHESQYGTTGVARFTRSWGNIRCAGYPTCLFGFRAYRDYRTAQEDFDRLIRMVYVNQWHCLTVAQIIPIYAPPSDGNDDVAYIHDVTSSITAWQHGEVLV